MAMPRVSARWCRQSLMYSGPLSTLIASGRPRHSMMRSRVRVTRLASQSLHASVKSLSLAVEAWQRPSENGETQKMTERVFVFATLDGQGIPRTIDPSREATQNESNHGNQVRGIIMSSTITRYLNAGA